MHTLALQGTAQGLLLVFTVLIARAVSLEVYGNFVFGFQLGQTMSNLLALGATFYLSRIFAEGVDSGAARLATFRFHNYYLYRGAFLLLLCALAFVLLVRSQAAIVSFGISSANYVLVMMMSFMTATGRAPLGNLLQAGRSLLLCASAIFSMYFALEVPLELALVAGATYAFGIFLVSGFVYSFRARIKSPIRRAGFAYQHVVTVLLAGADVLILEIVAPASEVAIYGVAFFVSSIASFALYAINANFTARISRSIRVDSLGQSQAILRSVARINLALTLPFLIGLVVVGTNLTVFYGSGFKASESIFLILLAGQCVNVFVGSVAVVANVSGNESRLTEYVAQALLFKALAGLVASYYYGAEGMAVAAAISTAYWNLRAYIFVRSELGLDTTPLALLRNP